LLRNKPHPLPLSILERGFVIARNEAIRKICKKSGLLRLKYEISKIQVLIIIGSLFFTACEDIEFLNLT